MMNRVLTVARCADGFGWPQRKICQLLFEKKGKIWAVFGCIGTDLDKYMFIGLLLGSPRKRKTIFLLTLSEMSE